MNSIKVIVKSYVNKTTGVAFSKASVKGKFLPELLHVNEDAYYNVRFINGTIALPTKEGVYEVEIASLDNDIWVDKRDGKFEENILRVRPTSCKFVKPLQDAPKPAEQENLPF